MKVSLIQTKKEIPLNFETRTETAEKLTVSLKCNRRFQFHKVKQMELSKVFKSRYKSNASTVIVKKVTSQSRPSRWAEGESRKKLQMKEAIRPYGFENQATALPVTPSLLGPAYRFQNWWEQGVKKIII